MLEELAWIGRRMDRLRRVLSDHEGEAVADLDTPATPGGHRHRVLFDLHAARLKLKAVLVRGFASPPEEQRRIARILERAADEILGRSRGKPA
jgi:hypothetical protein